MVYFVRATYETYITFLYFIAVPIGLSRGLMTVTAQSVRRTGTGWLLPSGHGHILATAYKTALGSIKGKRGRIVKLMAHSV